LTLRGDVIRNPGAYLAFAPSPVANNDFNDALAAGKNLKMFQEPQLLTICPISFVRSD
jgi:NAD dependent epimerase/dehydratase family enzyme